MPSIASHGSASYQPMTLLEYNAEYTRVEDTMEAYNVEDNRKKSTIMIGL